MITIATSHGEIVIELFEETAPLSCENFRRYAADDFFTETVFHRVIPNFMIQGGGMSADMRPKTTRAPVKNEAANGEKNLRGTLAMARYQNNLLSGSLTSRFVIESIPAINMRDMSFLK